MTNQVALIAPWTVRPCTVRKLLYDYSDRETAFEYSKNPIYGVEWEWRQFPRNLDTHQILVTLVEFWPRL